MDRAGLEWLGTWSWYRQEVSLGSRAGTWRRTVNANAAFQICVKAKEMWGQGEAAQVMWEPEAIQTPVALSGHYADEEAQSCSLTALTLPPPSDFSPLPLPLSASFSKMFSTPFFFPQA